MKRLFDVLAPRFFVVYFYVAAVGVGGPARADTPPERFVEIATGWGVVVFDTSELRTAKQTDGDVGFGMRALLRDDPSQRFHANVFRDECKAGRGVLVFTVDDGDKLIVIAAAEYVLGGERPSDKTAALICGAIGKAREVPAATPDGRRAAADGAAVRAASV